MKKSGAQPSQRRAREEAVEVEAGQKAVGDYNASSIQVLEGLEAVRKRPAMYIGDTATVGLHHLVWEVVDNSVDEALQSRCDSIDVTIHSDGSLSVLDNGAGIPTDLHSELKVPALEVILTKLHAGGKFEKGSYQVSGGLHGVGVSVVNALSEWLEVEVYRDGKVFRQTYERGKKTTELAILGETDECGTLIRFKPDPEIFETMDFVWELVHKRMRELAYLMGSYELKIVVSDERTRQRDELFYPEGIIDFVGYLNSGKNALHEDVIYIKRSYKDEERDETYALEVALQYNDGYNENIFSFVNNINTSEGGTHLSGFKSALTRSFNQFAKQSKLVKDKEKYPTGEDLREGLTAIISVKVPEPQFESQTKIRLGNREVEGIVNNIVGEGLRSFLEENPKVGKGIIAKAMEASRAREAARRAREQVRRKSAIESSELPLKLVDCHKGTPRERAELFLVEGDSAGGSAVTGRASYQAILPLRGKILNVEKAPLHKVMDHKEIEAIVSAIGTGFLDEEFDESKLRYAKIIIMTDADVDGSHIRTLLLTFFYRKMPELVKRGFIYVAQPPLYLVQKGKKQVYVHSDKDLRTTRFELGLDNLSLFVRDKEYRGTQLRRVVAVLDEIKRVGLSRRDRGGFGISELVLIQERFGKWPTHHILARSQRVVGPALRLVPPDQTGNGGRQSGKDEALEQVSLFVKGGEAELDDIIKRIAEEVRDLKVSVVGDRDETSDLVIETIHLPQKFRDLVAEAEAIELPLALFDEGPEGAAEDPDAASTAIRVRIAGDIKCVDSLVVALDEILNSQRKDIDVKRFKGLGEMEPGQLWESTMDPSTRVLYRVELADAVDADNLFTILMGSVVEPRREFIEKYALEVTNLDV